MRHPTLALLAVAFLLSPDPGIRAETAQPTLPPYVHEEEAGTLDLSGTWEFATDPKRQGVAERWYSRTLADRIVLPGTMAENRKGAHIAPYPRTNSPGVEYDYRGAAWYRKTIVVPEGLAGLPAEFSIGRGKVSRVWFDDVFLGENDSLGVTQRYRTGPLAPGTHTITVMEDNAARPAGRIGGHMLTSEVQSEWNGLLGELRLRPLRPLRLDAERVIPDVAARAARIRIRVANDGAAERKVRWTVRAVAWNTPAAAGFRPATVSGVATVPAGGGEIVARLPLGPDAPLWDEFSPTLYRATLSVSPEEGGPASTRETVFGLREFRREGTRFVINGEKVFLRGKHDAMAFPITGYAPMDEAAWYRTLSVAKSYGINHYRFHTCTPPEAAFRAADRLGVYLQPELYNNQGEYAAGPAAAYNLAEGMRILREYGDHPSFVMLSLGNEMGGGRALRAEHIAAFREFDPTRLYAQGTNNEWWNPVFAKGDDYWTTVRTARASVAKAFRGSFAHVDRPLGYIQTDRPSTEHDYSAAIAGVPVPVIGQETGQYQVFPDFREIAKYTGVQKPWNLATFKSRLEKAGLADRDAAFAAASGALAAICYREEIEAALRTPGFGGFQLLDLQDYPGQGTALVGMLDAFMDSKGIVSPEEWRRFCGPVVPLALFKSYTATNAERFSARVKVAQYGPRALPAGATSWRLTDAAGVVRRSGRIACPGYPQGELVSVGEIGFPLADLPSPARYTLTLEIEGAGAKNDYPLWVYPDEPIPPVPPGVKVATKWDDAAKAVLESGGTLVLLPDPAETKGVDGLYTPDFWNFHMFGTMGKTPEKRPPGTMGLLIDAHHPALRSFPTATHSDRQWFDLVTGSKALILDDAPKTLRPIVQVIDNVERNHRLGALFEARVGKGRLVVCSFGLPGKTASPVARRLTGSLLAYAAQATPAATLTYADVDRIFDPRPEKKTGDDPAYFEKFFRNPGER